MKTRNEPFAYGLFAGLLVLMLGLIANAMACCYAGGIKHAQVMQEYEASVEIDVVCRNADGSMTMWYGSGVIVDSERVITAGHVANPNGAMCSYQIKTWSEESRFMFVDKLDVTNDLATLRLSLGEKPLPDYHVRFGVVPRLGDVVCAASSFPMNTRKCGEVQPAPDGLIHFIAIVEPGNSGSGLYNSDGELVGIVVALHFCANHQWCTGIAVALPTHLKDLL